MRTYEWKNSLTNTEINSNLFSFITKVKNDRLKSYPSEKLDLVVITPKVIFDMIDVVNKDMFIVKYDSDIEDYIMLINKEKCNIEEILDMEFAKINIQRK